MADTDCLFCKIVSGELKGNIVHQDGDVTAFRDVNPQAPTHILVVPNRHVATVAELDDASLSHKLLQLATQLAKSEGLGNGYRLVANTGPDAGQTVFHVHWHLLGGRHMSWPPG